MKKVLLFLLIILISNVSALCGEGQIDINSASLEELDKLYGIGLTKAQAIVDTRPFSSVDDLINVSGIGEITLNKIKEQGLACVDNQEEESEENIQEEEPEETEENISEDEIADDEELTNEEESSIVKISSKEIQEGTEEEVKTIILTPKGIKSEIDKEQLSKNKLAIYGLVVFCILLVFLFIFKKGKKEKNEFR